MTKLNFRMRLLTVGHCRSQKLNDRMGDVEAFFIKHFIKFETNSIISQSKVLPIISTTNHHSN